MDRVAELEEQVRQLTADLEVQTQAKTQAYEELAGHSQRIDALEQELVDLGVINAREAARSTALELEATLYRERYVKSLQRISLVSRTVAIANAAREYLTAIERRGSLEHDVVARLEHLQSEVGLTYQPDEDPQHVIIIELEAELETLRRRVAELKDQCSAFETKVEDLETSAADWQELAEGSDRQLVEIQKELRHWQDRPAEVRHALAHVVRCERNCDFCRRLAERALDWGNWRPT